MAVAGPVIGDRMRDKVAMPDAAALLGWMGPEAHGYWQRLAGWIEETYPGVFEPDWVYGGAKHGWALRYKKSKSFCTFVPEYRQFAIVIVFGAEERGRMEFVLPELPTTLRERYLEAPTYHDGKWVKLIVPADAGLPDIEKLLSTKRRAKPRG